MLEMLFLYRVVKHEHVHKNDHCTISRKGVTRMRSDDETEFITLDRWEQEVNYFNKLIQVSYVILHTLQGENNNQCQIVSWIYTTMQICIDHNIANANNIFKT